MDNTDTNTLVYIRYHHSYDASPLVSMAHHISTTGLLVYSMAIQVIPDGKEYEMTHKRRLVCWYSNGAASLIAAKKAIDLQPTHYPDCDVVVVRIYIKEEYHEPERDDDIHVFGFDCDEGERRVNNLLDTEPDINYFCPLMELNITKRDCFHEMRQAGIDLPMMYVLGFHNNNCIGCVKASGAGYWNKTRYLFPDTFFRRAEQERMCNTAMVSMSREKFMRDYPHHFERMVDEWEDRYKSTNKKRADGTVYEYRVSLIPLRFLPPDAGDHKDLDIGDCGFVCEMKQ